MKRKILVMTIFVGLSIFVCGSIFAQESYEATTVMPEATGVSITVSQIDPNAGGDPTDPATHGWAPNPGGGTTLNFGTLKEDSAETIIDGKIVTWVGYFPDYYFALDIAMAGGGVPASADPKVQITPGSQASDPYAIEERVIITASFPYITVWPTTGEPDDPAARVTLSKADLDYSLKDLATATNPGWLRVYVGIATFPDLEGGEPALPPEAKPFTGLDIAGTYLGDIDITVSGI